MPPGYSADPDAWLYDLDFPQFATQSPKGNATDPLATIPAGSTPFIFSAPDETRLKLRARIFEIPAASVAATNGPDYSVPTRALAVAVGDPTLKPIWNGTEFSAGAGTVLKYCRRVISFTWNQLTNAVSEVEVSGDLRTWTSLQNIRYSGQWEFTVADALEDGPKFYRLSVQPP